MHRRQQIRSRRKEASLNLRSFRVQYFPSYSGSKLGIPFRETSARLATNVDALFEELVEIILNNNGGTIGGSKRSVGESPQKGTGKEEEKAPERDEGMKIK